MNGIITNTAKTNENEEKIKMPNPSIIIMTRSVSLMWNHWIDTDKFAVTIYSMNLMQLLYSLNAK